MFSSIIYSLLVLGTAVDASPATNPVLETSDFNVTKALLTHGVDVSKISALHDVSKRSEEFCAAACTSLKFLYGESAVETRDEKAYNAFRASYWSGNQADVSPQCIFKPSKQAHVSVVVLLSRLTQCPFAAKSGGHAAFAGASGSEGGITISFANLKAVKLSNDKKIASIEPGNIWGDVYAQLAKSDLTVVLANGNIVKATFENHSDLYWALRGGGNNFGLVVRFNMKTYPLPGGRLWGGTRIYTEDSFPALTNAITNLINNSPKDPKAGFWSVWAYVNGTKIAQSTLYHADPGAGGASIWRDFDSLKPVTDTTKSQQISDWAKEETGINPYGLREMYYSVTTKVDKGLLQFAQDYLYKTVPKVANVRGLIPALVVQGITVPQLRKMEQNGGNPLGLKADEGPFLLYVLACMWADKADDAVMFSWISNFIKTVNTEARKRGLGSDFIYMNYASQYQDVIASYGSTNKAQLKKTAKKYDPHGVYQQLQPGYFKLDGAPVPESGL
ncbi:hypothetical protein NW762_012036 [Fusarium torreyae]|uniref:FAD linked oxidase N-terminal domain-containing protein n=1 Tax=Fusarium torreyae TaxID=1237075 RepID=A0A9W8RNH5_9HYPO|nr:hypothetical protein NW762_012036 [Fusarium torreyae]